MKKKFSLQLQLTSFLLLFVFAILGVIYIFQTSFLDEFYERNKINTLQSVASTVSTVIGQEDFERTLDHLGMSNEVCVRVVSNSDEYDYVGACALRNLQPIVINQIAKETIENDNEKLFDEYHYQRSFEDRPEYVYIYSKMLKINNEDVMVLVSSGITPLNVTISTLKSQYFVIASVVIVMSIILSILISRFILNPIRQINEESTKLSKGEYDGSNVKTSSKEFDQLNNNLIDANVDILKADQAKKELLGNVSHDLRTPLTMIVGYGEMMRDLPEENNEDNINVIIDEAKRLTTLVNDLIDISKLEDNKVELNKEVVKLNDLLTSVYHQYEKYCQTQDIDFELVLTDDIDVYVDENRIKQVLYNFLNNSLNHNDKDDKKIILGTEKINDIYRVYVYDNGEGIAEDDIGNIWDRYYKVNKEHKRYLLGSGIGLSLCRDLLEAHELAYGVDSKVDEYSKFYFDLKKYE